jgi:hypothetical protein
MLPKDGEPITAERVEGSSMMTSKFLVAVATLTVALAGCTGRSPRPVQIDNERPGKDGREGPAQDAEPVGPLDEDIVTDDGEPAADD